MDTIRVTNDIQLNVIDLLLLFAVVWLGLGMAAAVASGTNVLGEMSAGVTAVGDTLQSEEIVGRMSWWIVAFGSLALLGGVLGGGWVSFFVLFIIAGVLLNGQNIIETIGWTAVPI